MGKYYSYGICPYKIENDTIQIALVQAKGHTEWGFIKGKIDKNETIQECAQRECKEETNIRFDINNLEDYFYQVNNKKNVGIFLININNLDTDRIKLAKRELQDYRFFNIQEEINISKNQSKILQSIKEKFK